MRLPPRCAPIAAARPNLSADAGEHHFQHLSAVLNQLQQRVREQIQAATQTEIAGVIATLDAGTDPTPAQLDLIRLWMVGDAEHYVRLEGDYRTWVAELDRLVGEMTRAQAAVLTVTDLSKLMAWRATHNVCSRTSSTSRRKNLVCSASNRPPRASPGTTSACWRTFSDRSSPRIEAKPPRRSRAAPPMAAAGLPRPPQEPATGAVRASGFATRRPVRWNR